MNMGFRIWYPEWPYPENVLKNVFRIWMTGYGSGYGIRTGHILKMFLKTFFRIRFSGYGSGYGIRSGHADAGCGI